MTKVVKLLLVTIILNSLNAQVSFTENASASGISVTCGDTYIGNGVSFYDYDMDGLDDITLTTDANDGLRFYKNIGGFFVQQTINIPDLNYQTKQVNWVDIDNDGDKDLFATSNTNGNRLFRNDGNLNFTDITVAAGLPTSNLMTYGASWGDYNNDGFLDVFISNRDATVNTSNPNYLFKNNGNGTFTDVSVIAGIDREKHLSFCSAFIDFNNDGWQDIYISNDKLIHRNQLYKNNGDGTFTEFGAASNSDVLIDAMTVTVGDYNADGWFDIYITNLGRSVFLKNNGDETFTDVATETGTEFDSIGWGAIFLDADNDTDLDLYVSSSAYNSDTYISSAFYENKGDGIYQIPANAGFENDDSYSHCNAIGDINNDGLVDFVVTNTHNQNVFLWQNQNTSNNNWLKVKLEGTTSNRDGIGSVIEISVNGQKQYGYTLCGEGYLSQNSGYEFFGLGQSTVVDYIKVTWLSGIEDVYFNVPGNQVFNVLEGSSLSIDEFNETTISLSPNPMKDVLRISATKPITEITIYNVLNQMVFKQRYNTSELTINSSEFSPGIYFVKAATEHGMSTYKLIKE
ncbi:MAG: T9SS type A sorting domain-containing protein [Winogradskyella sp.]|nr:T9SS type A sorting domain-containing protein [Winogradskyella sp.]